MSCPDPLEDEILEGYLLGRLSSAQRDAAEEHLFSCADCSQRLETLQALRQVLSAGERWQPWRSWVLGVAAVIAVGLGVSLLRAPASDPRSSPIGGTPAPTAVDIASLGRFDPPTWDPRRLRSGGEADRRFAAGMEAYARGEWLAAAADLEEAARLDPEAPAPAFFAGLCRLLAGELEVGARALARVVDLGETSYLEDALLHLARARLLQRDGSAARALLERVELLGGERAEEAHALIRRLDAARIG